MKSAIAWIPALIGDTSLTLFIVGLALGYTRNAPPTIAFLLAALGMALGVVATAGGLVVIVRSGANLQAGMALLGLPPALFLIYALVGARGAPIINDVSTDLAYPPPLNYAKTVPVNEGRDLSYPESFKSQVEDAYPDLQSLGLNKRRDDVFVKALDIARKQPGWTVKASTVTPTESVIEGEAETQLFGFVDDWVVRITDAQGGGVVVDMRSKSREGKGDLGANAARIRDFFSQLQS